ncbi:CRP-like cAMP-binding protein [Rhodobium orientis]|uniref:Cyclic nucleotide-binding protein n=1 Tax=Rhodobium orientis TaxID=34017 RepID=A0A327JJQ7_9HYPH|nr:Crp/Fnr family transcriptional regulator [Rhodobium orientis]MBB4305081.1 CRP-like cAMP-binding protein [Rhodobium orientis]MBK5948605.1 cyclic nucleotide-binding protein [Rhodobium orientis]RAI25634.1 cyclic nucleotide-binding protein [Rhodobium orientis]
MTLNAEVEALRKVPLFRKIDTAKLRLLAFISDRVTVRAGEDLCRQGESGDSAFIVLDGEADVLVETDQGLRKVAGVATNDIVGEIAILCDVPRTATIRATTEMAILSINKDNFLKLLKEFPDIALEVMRVLAARLERTTRDLADLRSATGGN